MAAEDFAFMLGHRPGCYIWLGAGEDRPGLHHPQYDFNDAVLGVGASYWVSLAEIALPLV
jgi:hippurate hydrolase